jgi:hypothetical protein
MDLVRVKKKELDGYASRCLIFVDGIYGQIFTVLFMPAFS